MQITITFGMFLDGAEWSQEKASLGEIKLGPSQFIEWLETRLGLDGVSVSAPERINEYMQKIQRVKPSWCRESFELDPWSTARQMLSWRDELLENGWDGKSGDSERLKALASLEAKNTGPLSPGIPERLQTILKELKNYPFAGTLVLQDPRELLPCLWQQVVKQLGECGMEIPPGAQGETEAGSATPKKILLHGANEFALAKELVRFLSAGANDRTALICEGDSSLLDGFFQRNGIGRLNAAERSRWRESLQILPLWLETLWAPFNPQHFLELLLLPGTPVPKPLADNLIYALQKEPGYDGKEWKNAWEKVEKVNPKNPDFQACADVWNKLKECFQAKDEIDAGKIIVHCDFLIKHLSGRIGKHHELALAAEHARTLKKILGGRKTPIKRMELARMLDSIISTGTTGTQDGREHTDFAVFSHPGMVDRDFNTILWWNFTDNGIAHATNWTADERKVMPGFNRTAARELENLSWRNALKHANHRIIFFVPQKRNRAETFPHPFLDELEINEELTSGKLTDSQGKWTLAGRTLQLDKKTAETPEVKAEIGADNAIRPTRRLSYSTLEKLISCPFKWFMDDYLGLTPAPAMTVPSGPPMLGTLAHKIVENIYKGKETLTVEEASSAAGEEFDRLLPSMAAELLLDGRNVERDRIRNILVEAIKVLAKEIKKQNLLVKDMEKELHGTFDGMEFIGYSDIYLEDAKGGKFVIDMKWSSDSRYEKALQEDKALQLAVYSWLLDAKELDVRCAYFLFPGKQLIFAPEKQWKALWDKAGDTWKQRFNDIRAGKLEQGVKDEKELKGSELPLPLTAKCSFCNYAALCAMIKEKKQDG